jgi:hypothetical protein
MMRNCGDQSALVRRPSQDKKTGKSGIEIIGCLCFGWDISNLLLSIQHMRLPVGARRLLADEIAATEMRGDE